jgi:hypothetical protein
MKLKSLVLLMSLAGIFACSGPPANDNQNEESTSNSTSSDSDYVDDMGDVVRGFDSIEALAASLIKSLADNDYRGYLSHTMTEEMELAQADLITNPDGKEKFVSEYGFSLREERHYFDFTIKYFEEHFVDLSAAEIDEIDYMEYKPERYAPLELYEVFIPVETSGWPETIDLIVIKIDDKFYMTSEMGI